MTCSFGNRPREEGSIKRGSASNGVVLPPIKDGRQSFFFLPKPSRPSSPSLETASSEVPIAPSILRDGVYAVPAMWQAHGKGDTSKEKAAPRFRIAGASLTFSCSLFFLAADAFSSVLTTADAAWQPTANSLSLSILSLSSLSRLTDVCALGQGKVGVAPHARGVELVRRDLGERLPPALVSHCFFVFAFWEKKRPSSPSTTGLDFFAAKKRERARARFSPPLPCAGEVRGALGRGTGGTSVASCARGERMSTIDLDSKKKRECDKRRFSGGYEVPQVASSISRSLRLSLSLSPPSARGTFKMRDTRARQGETTYLFPVSFSLFLSFLLENSVPLSSLPPALSHFSLSFFSSFFLS